ncbi:MAG: TetR/AcrR family transcriptional regulator, partial [Treponema sp.]|nr:TetR/AcrR family transcriptional regulator [Treponema sp.]
MDNERETKEKLLQSAKTEFLEKGYTAASLRTICKNAGVTTGALYFFFKDKEDLFASLVQAPLEKIMGIVTDHYAS